MFRTAFAVMAAAIMATGSGATGSGATGSGATGADDGYRKAQAVPAAGGSVQILEDARLTPALARRLWRSGVDPVSVLGEDNPAAQPFKTEPLRPARLRQVNAAGAVILDIALAKAAPIARIEARRLGRPSDPVYLVTTDDDAGFGSYSGRATRLYASEGARLQPVSASDGAGQTEAIVLIDTLKSGWKIVDARPNHTVIHQLLCRPDPETRTSSPGVTFLLSYISYESDGRTWRMAKHVSPGFWESDQAWPAADRFPSVRP